ncbi:MAG: tetratricopeptide repeat protein [Alphaproteobacteria bacterium]|nr:tetratricopeptide repeat protein [Alphaproteobacteria bacterium]
MSDLLQTAVAYHQAGNAVEAEGAYRAFLAGQPHHRDALRFLGGLYLQMGRPAEAVDYLNRAVAINADVETLTNLGIALRGAGRGAESLAACERALKAAPHTSAARRNYAAALFLAGKIDAAIAWYHQALDADPDDLSALINLGLAYSDIGRGDAAAPWLAQAQARLEQIAAANPSDAATLNQLGTILQRQGKLQDALPPYRRALEIQPGYAQAALNLATCLRALGHPAEAVDMCRYAIGLMPDSSDAYTNLGVFLQETARHDDAVAAFENALRLNPNSLLAKRNMSFSLLALGRYDEGWAMHETGLGITSMRGKNPFPERRWTGQDVTGKRLLIWCEQGMGDDLQFIRYAPLCKARGCTLAVQCPAPLRRLFATVSGIDRLVDHVGADDFDVHASLMSLPYIFGTRLETVPAQGPYLRAPDDARAQWAALFPARTGNLRVGLVWAGNPHENQINAHLTDRRRSMALETLRPLFDVAGVDFYSLQMGAAAVAQIDVCGLRSRIADIMGDVRDFADTAAIIENLDLVISVDTSVVHLAGGLGKPVWVMSRFDACWRWLQNRPDNPWYPSARVFGQPAPGDWASVVDRVAAALAAFKTP